MYLKKIISISVLVLFSCVNAKAQCALTLEQCREMAISSNATIKSSQIGVASSEDVLSMYKTNHLPKLSLGVNYLYSTASLSETIPSFNITELVASDMFALLPAEYQALLSMVNTPEVDLELSVESLFNASAKVVQPIYMGSKIRSAVSMAQVGVEVSRLKLQLDTNALLVEVDNAFYTHLMLMELSRSADSYYTVVKEFNRKMVNAFQAGMKTRNDMLKVQVALNDAELKQRKANNAIILSRMNLCHLIGLPMTTKELNLVDEVQLISGGKAPMGDVTERVEYKLLEKQIEAKKLETKIAKSDFLPSVAALASYGYTHGLQFNGNNLFSSMGFTGGVTVSVPLFSWGEGRYKVRAKEREEEQALLTLKDNSELMTLEMMQAINVLDEAHVELLMREKALEQATENMRLSLNQYEAGMESLADYLESQALWQQAMSNKVSTLSALRVANSRYLKAIGKLSLLTD